MQRLYAGASSSNPASPLTAVLQGVPVCQGTAVQQKTLAPFLGLQHRLAPQHHRALRSTQVQAERGAPREGVQQVAAGQVCLGHGHRARVQVGPCPGMGSGWAGLDGVN